MPVRYSNQGLETFQSPVLRSPKCAIASITLVIPIKFGLFTDSDKFNDFNQHHSESTVITGVIKVTVEYTYSFFSQNTKFAVDLISNLDPPIRMIPAII